MVNYWTLLVSLFLVLSVASEPVIFRVNTDLTADVLTQIRNSELTTINLYREIHGVPILTLDSALTAQAQTHAEALYSNQDPDDLAHSEGFDDLQYGENIFWKFQLSDFEYNQGSVTTQWYAESDNYSYESGQPIISDHIVKHFTAFMWKGVTNVGIGCYGGEQEYMGMLGVGLYCVFQFSPRPNLEGQYIENVMSPITIA